MIYSAYHLDAPVPKCKYYTPVHVGKANSDKDFGFIGDNTGNHISEKNGLYSELTLQYWIWQNCVDAYVGLAHYRRSFVGNEVDSLLIGYNAPKYYEYDKPSRPETPYKPELFDAAFNMQNLEDFRFRMERGETEAVVLTAFKRSATYPLFTLAGTQQWLSVRAVSEFYDLLREKLPRAEYQNIIDVNHKQLDHYCNNMIYTSREIFNGYSEWLFDILFEFEDRLRSIEFKESRELIKPRMFGYFSEYLLKPYLTHRNIRVEESQSLCFTDLKTDSRI